MLIHYVDDSKEDIISLKRTLRDQKSVRMRATERIDQIKYFKDFESIDAFVLDVVRPDAISIEGDIEAIRKFTDAPVLFLTGQDQARLSARALEAGAHAVLHKDTLDVMHLMQCLEQACERHLLARAQGTVQDRPDWEHLLTPSGRWPMLEPSLAANDEALAYIYNALGGQTRETKLDGDAVAARARGLVSVLRQIGNRQFANSVLIDASRVLATVFDDLTPDICAQGVKVTLEVLGSALFWSVGSRQDAEVGLRSLLESAVYLSERGNLLHIEVSRREGITRVDISSRHALLSGRGDIFEPTTRADNQPSYGLALLRSAVHLLALRPEQVIFSSDVTNRISIFL